jgi:thiol-disulfide isomerase/thioredoxin
MPSLLSRYLLLLLVGGGCFPAPSPAQERPGTPAERPAEKLPKPVIASERSDLQKAIDDAGTDRAALVRNLENFLKKYPESSQRPQIYRAIVEACLQLRDFPRATEYAERMVALTPEDSSINVLSVQLLERYGDTAGWHRATYYCSRVLDLVARASQAEKSPRVSNEEWETEKNRNLASVLLVRGRLYKKLNNLPDAQKDFEMSYKLAPASAAAEQLGELAELKKDLNTAIEQYARAFARFEGSSSNISRAELRRKLGNVWRLAHGTEEGLGDYLLHAVDEVSATAATARPARNNGLREPNEFVLRKVPEGTPFPLADTKGKIVVLNFWATWCGPCRELEPHFERIAARYAGQKDIVFYGLNCDEDESLVAPFVAEEKPRTTVLFADGLDHLLNVESFPTTVILDRTGKIAYRSEGFDPDDVDKTLAAAVERALHPPDAAANQSR